MSSIAPPAVRLATHLRVSTDSTLNAYRPRGLWAVFAVLALFLSPVTADAQEQPHPLIPPGFELRALDPPAASPTEAPGPPAKTLDLSGYATVASQAQVGGTPWPRPDIGTTPSFDAVPAGDVNGDGIDDWVYQARFLPDEQTVTLTDRTPKTFLKYGGAGLSSTYYDALYRQFLIPAGNLFGSGEADAVRIDPNTGAISLFAGSASGYVDTGESVPIGTTGFSAVGAGDIDGDGFGDLVFTYENLTDVAILFGAAAAADVTIDTFFPSVPDEALFAHGLGNVDDDPAVELVRISGQPGTGSEVGLVVQVFAYDTAARALTEELRFSTTALQVSGNTFFIDAVVVDEVTDGGLAEIIVTFLSGTETIVFQSFNGETSYDASGADYGVARPIGDADGDATGDFLLRTSAGLFFAFGGASSLTPGPEVPVAAGETVPFSRSEGVLGDATGDGRADVHLRRIGATTFGPLLASLPAGGATVDIGFEFTRSDYRSEDIEQTINVGRWDADADDDVLLLVESFMPGDAAVGGRADLLLGDPATAGIPDLSIAHPSGAEPAFAVAGDFTGNGQRNLAVGWVSEAPLVSVYEAGQGAVPIHTIDFADLPGNPAPPSFGARAVVENAGDVNGDGTDDLLVGVPDEPAEVYLYLGRPALQAAPDATVGTTASGYGSSLQALGDINSDGADDFAAGALLDDTIRVFFGAADTLPDVSSPDVTIELSPGPNELLSFFPLGMAAGDFNGDGTPDLAAMPFFFQDLLTGDGIEAIRIYHGGTGFDDVPDATLPVPAGPLDFSGTESGGGFLFRSVGERTRLPDLDQDGSDELLIGSAGGFTTNALLFAGSGAAVPTPTTVLQAPDAVWGLGANNNNTLNSNRSSAVGDFGGDGQVTVLLPQDDDPNFLGAPVYSYPLGDGDLAAGRASADVTTAPDGTASVSFNAFEVGLSGIDFRGASGTGRVEALFFANAPSNTNGIAETNASTYRVVLQATGSFSFAEADVRFGTSALEGITDASDVTVYRRDAAGTGPFAEVPAVQFDPATGDLIATVTSFSEFVLASDTNPLPVELSAFSASAAGEAVQLSWTTASETGNAGFAVERSTDGALFTAVGFEPGGGTTTEARRYRFVDDNLPFTDVAYYRLKQVDLDGVFEYSDVVTVALTPERVELLSSAPNPFRVSTRLRYTLPDRAAIELHVFDVLGRRVRTLVDRQQDAGRYTVWFNGAGLAAGTYFVRLRAAGQVQTRSITLVK